MDSLASDGAFWTAGSLLGGLVHQLPSCSSKGTNKIKSNQIESNQNSSKERRETFRRSKWGKIRNGGDTGGFDDAVLVGLGGVAVALAVGETLHHF